MSEPSDRDRALAARWWGSDWEDIEDLPAIIAEARAEGRREALQEVLEVVLAEEGGACRGAKVVYRDAWLLAGEIREFIEANLKEAGDV